MKAKVAACRGPRTYQDITLFDSWLSNAFIYGLALLALVASLPLIPNAQTMMDAAGGEAHGSSQRLFQPVVGPPCQLAPQRRHGRCRMNPE